MIRLFLPAMVCKDGQILVNLILIVNRLLFKVGSGRREKETVVVELLSRLLPCLLQL